MTGFGRYEITGGPRFTVEMKSVNHRYFDSNIKMPKKTQYFLNLLFEIFSKEYIQWKVDILLL